MLKCLIIYLADHRPKRKFKYSFERADIQQNQEDDLMSEVIAYLQSPYSEDENNLDQLAAHKHIQVLFLKFNGILTSSAPVERLFSLGSKLLLLLLIIKKEITRIFNFVSELIQRPQRNKLSDSTFEKLLYY